MQSHKDDLIEIEYDQELPQSQTADKPIAPRGRATQQSLDPGTTNLEKLRKILTVCSRWQNR